MDSADSSELRFNATELAGLFEDLDAELQAQQATRVTLAA